MTNAQATAQATGTAVDTAPPAAGGPGRGIAFLKGHGTENDFVIVPDPDGVLELSADAVARICDRRAGVGGDGLLRVVRSAADPAARAQAAEAEWFMDYRNGDGSVAEMCGNGIRVFARYLQHAGLVGAGEFAIATRAGVKRVRLAEDGDVTVSMGRAALLPDGVTVTVGDRSWPARNVNMGNPHAVAFVEDLDHAGDLYGVPPFSPAAVYPDGVNIEFVADRGPRHVAMRVHERGAGETRSCGTGACAVAVAAARRDGIDPAATGSPVTYRVDLPGGSLSITELPDGTVEMTGPAVIVAHGTLDPAWLVTALD
ncbi:MULTISPECIES: diaminopimelate epimerase [Streptomyces]|uniref:Diaminopimelate epimerase n=2 Tax=Streptomyces rimosus subsp. rimosus TaxID=132474 RepID=L8EEA3_STRR1|nr:MULTISPECIES: diaminopimelate epimerase [Streptomyces]MYT43806.1 diaminopimelate epimerase [Streptomyces sp. SID5471]KEF02004.1 diaminopimelate epimerase [Streptomyces rimosus]KUJ30952.1 diaminopimelate epimerase [Streptomyces rimosus subsp. rimosus]QDA04054.1 diaminopimelate epimerase [Streptomyces rimosus]QEV75339.1 diaminopimelate epimerase [Streptomyces rimosus]